MSKFLSDKWLEECFEALEENEDFRKKVRGQKGRFVLCFEGKSEEESKFVFFSIRDGRCDEASYISNRNEVDFDYRISASIEFWKSMIKGEVDALEVFLKRKIKIEGSVLGLLGKKDMLISFVKALTSVPVELE